MQPVSVLWMNGMTNDHVVTGLLLITIQLQLPFRIHMHLVSILSEGGGGLLWFNLHYSPFKFRHEFSNNNNNFPKLFCHHSRRGAVPFIGEQPTPHIWSEHHIHICHIMSSSRGMVSSNWRRRRGTNNGLYCWLDILMFFSIVTWTRWWWWSLTYYMLIFPCNAVMISIHF